MYLCDSGSPTQVVIEKQTLNLKLHNSLEYYRRELSGLQTLKQ